MSQIMKIRNNGALFKIAMKQIRICDYEEELANAESERLRALAQGFIDY
jgi:hypothetical protein